MTPLQKTELEIALEIKRVCDENEIDYFLDGGTLLGAIRHKGFIPWDDDMDLGMKRKEYDRFISIANEKLDSKYILQTWNLDSGFPFAFAKVRKKNTVFIEATSQKCKHNNGVYVDIFPYDSYPDNQSQRDNQGKKLMKYSYYMMMKMGMTPWKRDTGFHKLMVFLKYGLYKILGSFISYNRCKQTITDELTKYNDTKHEFVFSGVPISKYGKWVMPAKYIDEMTTVSFEGHMFKAPLCYDDFLTRGYGDYMTLPPENQRVTHQPVEIKL